MQVEIVDYASLQSLTVKELRLAADERNIDLSDATKKGDIVDRIAGALNITNPQTGENQGGNIMEDKDLQVTTEFDGNAPTGAEAAAEAADDRVWHDKDGNEVSKSAFIREQFLHFNKSRKQIAEEFNINYRTVYGATVNLTNDAEPAGRGRSAANAKIKVTADNQVVTVVDGVAHVDGEPIEGDAPETTEVDRNEWIKQQVEAGVSRGDVAKKLGLSYGVVYGITKEMEGTRAVHEYEHNGETVSRSEYIRRLHAEGMSKADIAKQLGVEYSVVWSATKAAKSDDEKYLDQVDKLAKFADKVEDAEAFNALIEQLKAVTFKAEEATEEPAADTESVYAE